MNQELKNKINEKNLMDNKTTMSESKISDKHYKNKYSTEKPELKSSKSERKLLELKQKLEESQLKNLSLLADMENLKKRLEKERFEIISFSNIGLLQQIIPTLDMFKRALGAKNVSEEIKNWLLGFEMIRNNFDQILKDIGVQEIKVKEGDEYNSKYHEAVDAIYSDKVSKDYVLKVNQTGYLLNDRLIRPASVIVSKGIMMTENSEN